MWGIATKKIGRVAVKEQGKSGALSFTHSLTTACPENFQFLAKKNYK